MHVQDQTRALRLVYSLRPRYSNRLISQYIIGNIKCDGGIFYIWVA